MESEVSSSYVVVGHGILWSFNSMHDHVVQAEQDLDRWNRSVRDLGRCIRTWYSRNWSLLASFVDTSTMKLRSSYVPWFIHTESHTSRWARQDIHYFEGYFTTTILVITHQHSRWKTVLVLRSFTKLFLFLSEKWDWWLDGNHRFFPRQDHSSGLDVLTTISLWKTVAVAFYSEFKTSRAFRFLFPIFNSPYPGIRVRMMVTGTERSLGCTEDLKNPITHLHVRQPNLVLGRPPLLTFSFSSFGLSLVTTLVGGKGNIEDEDW